MKKGNLHQAYYELTSNGPPQGRKQPMSDQLLQQLRERLARVPDTLPKAIFTNPATGRPAIHVADVAIMLRDSIGSLTAYTHGIDQVPATPAPPVSVTPPAGTVLSSSATAVPPPPAAAPAAAAPAAAPAAAATAAAAAASASSR